jgi:hypothetical protein
MTRLTKSQADSFLYAKCKFNDGRIPPYLFRDYRSIRTLLSAGFIEFRYGYGCPMYQFTQLGLDALDRAAKAR